MVSTDLAHGGRWTSLPLGGREWLWHRDAPRDTVRPGDAFVDAGGLEECVPTVRGNPDHGAAWSHPWKRNDGRDEFECPEFTLSRTISTGSDTVQAGYRLTADPGYRFVWAAHALLDLAVGAHIEVPHGAPVRIYPDGGAMWTAVSWPTVSGTDMSRLGPDDGTALGAVLPDLDAVAVVDRGHRLRMTLSAPGVPTAVALWRNLGGFPDEGPYRSVGVEPMLGRVFDLAAAGPDDAAMVPASGQVRWTLTISAAVAG